MIKNRKIKITTIGGGSGQSNLLFSLRDILGIEISAIVSMVDSGGSTGRLRDEFGVLPPGDILKCILALSPHRAMANKILQTRFKSGSRLKGHNAGNMLLTILAQHSGNFSDGVNALGKVLDIKGKVFPVTLNRATLAAELTDNSFLYGESTIDVPRDNRRKKIKNIFLVPHYNDSIKAYSPAMNAIKEAKYIIIGPGDLYTSIIPNFLVPGIKEAIGKSRAKLIYVVNIMTKFGETDHFTGKDFVLKAEGFLDKKFDFVLINLEKPNKNLLNDYKKQKSSPVKLNIKDGWANRRVIAKNLLDTSGGIIRHSSEKLKDAVTAIIKTNFVI